MPAPYWWSRLVHASRVLTFCEKLVWDEHRMLDGPDGCYATAATLAGRLGTTARTVEGARASLLRAGLLERSQRGQRSRYHVLLPGVDIHAVGVRPSDATVVALLTQFDLAVATARGNGSLRSG